MAHFAQLNENNVVVNVIVVSNEDTSDENGIEIEEIGITFCKNLLGENTIWKQTSYNNNFRCRYAGIGFTYDEQLDAFIPPKPFDSWIFNQNTLNWDPPIPEPEDYSEVIYTWNEEILNWEPFY